MTDSSRGYGMRPGPLQSIIPPFTPAVKGLIGACVVVFMAQVFLQLAGGGGFEPSGHFVQAFGLVPHAFLHSLRLWQAVTYLFLHGDFLGHLLFNMLSLWMFGSALESEWGTRRFLFYYLLTGIGAGLVTVAFTPGAVSPTIGASGAIFGLILAFGVLFPNRPIFVYAIFPVKAKWFALAAGLVTLWSSWAYAGDGVAHVAHLGGMLFGYAYLKRVWRVGEVWRELRWRLRRRRFRVIRRRGNGDPRYPFH